MPLGALIGGFLEGVAEGELRRRDQEYQRFRMDMERERLELQRAVEERQIRMMEENARREQLQEERLARKERFAEFNEPFSQLPPDVAARAAPQLEEARSLFMEQELRPGSPTAPAPEIGPPEREDFAARRARISQEIAGVPQLMENEAEIRREREKQRDFERAKALKRLEASLSIEKAGMKPKKPLSGPILSEVNSHTNARDTIKDLRELIAEKGTTGPLTQFFASKYARALGMADEDVLRTSQNLKLTTLDLVLKYARTTFPQSFQEHMATLNAAMFEQPESALVMLEGLDKRNEREFKQKLINARLGGYEVDDLLVYRFGPEALAEAMITGGGAIGKLPPGATPTVTYQDPVSGKKAPIPLNRPELIQRAKDRNWIKVD